MRKLNNSFVPNMGKVLLMALLLCLCVSPSVCYSADPEMIMVPRQQYTQLVEINTRLTMKLETLCLQTEMLKAPSAQLVSELTEARTLLETTKKQLMTSNANLKNAESLLKQAESSLMTLEKKIEADRAKAKAIERRLRWQRTIGYMIAGAVILISA